MWVTRMFIIAGATALIAFFVWPLVRDANLSGDISIHAGGFNAQVPAVMGIFATLGLAAMLFAVKR